MVIGSGGLSIGQAGEFDYSGSQAIKALKESNVYTILVNPNIATIQTSENLADEVYFTPITLEHVSKLIESTKPDGILLTFGGQTALNCGIQLDQSGILNKYNVEVLGTPINTLICSEDRELFVKALNEIDIPVAQSTAVETVEDALKAASEIGYPIIIRSAYALGGLGSGFANNELELKTLATQSLALSSQILVEKSMKGWKEIEYEVVRDKDDNCITICNMENFDPLGIHTGDSIVVAPSQTLSDEEYHMLRTAAIKIVRHVGVVGECNVQYALNPESLEFKVIEMNARLSRSSALASKATGYPLAFVAAKLALGYTLPKLKNSVTKETTACFEPSLDYIVTKIPRWDLNKFQGVNRQIGSSMKSVGEVMAIGRNFEESLQKAIRMVDPSYPGFQPINLPDGQNKQKLEEQLKNADDKRIFYLAIAMMNYNYTVDELHELTKIDKWFLYKLNNIYKHSKLLNEISFNSLTPELLLKSKQLGFSDFQLSQTLLDKHQLSEEIIRNKRLKYNLLPKVKRIDTLAGEYPTNTNYLYTTYNADESDIIFDKNPQNTTLVLGSGVYRIGSSVEFDWSAVSCINSLKALNHSTIMLNYNPETVSTDFDQCDKLYFEELSLESVLNIYYLEQCNGVVVSMGGQLPQNIALKLKQNQCNVLGTDPEDIDSAENRCKFSNLLDEIDIDQPKWQALTTVHEAKQFANKVHYPVLVRPSYVLSGAAMNIAYNSKELDYYLSLATAVSPEYPVVITKFELNSEEIDIDGVAQNGELMYHAISNHIEPAGVHSGDASLILPSYNLSNESKQKLKLICQKLSHKFQISGPFNLQIIRQLDQNNNENFKVIELNLRASRSVPFVSKVLGVNFIEKATQAFFNLLEPLTPKQELTLSKKHYFGVKVPQFSWTRLIGANPKLGVEMGSTGEVAAFGQDPYMAYLLALQCLNNFKLPKENECKEEDLKLIINSFINNNLKLFTLNKELSDQFKEIKLLENEEDLKIRLNPMDLICNLNSKADSNNIPRLAVDLNIPLLNHPSLVLFFAKAITKYPVKKHLELLSLKPWSYYLKQ
ncbi:carbamoyl-phosphate synthase [Neoconidiobolus thromboides FSU 785]|nr:carbamoyl-phosphate synthase [Neoconidiobolus thromboides FSU 785]